MGPVLCWARGEAAGSPGLREAGALEAQGGVGLEVGWTYSPLQRLETRGWALGAV